MHDFNKVRSVLEMFYTGKKGAVLNLPLVEYLPLPFASPLSSLEAQG